MPQSNTHTDLRDELRTAPVEPLLPIEKKLIGWSLGIGLVAARRAGGDQSFLSGDAA